MPKVVIAGGSGFLGFELVKLLRKLDYEVVVLSRSGKGPEGARSVVWDAQSVGPWTSELEGATAVVNFVGENAIRKWTNEAKLEILQSRLRSTKAIGEALSRAKDGPKVWINASAIGIYGDRGGEELDEQSAVGPRRDFLVDTCVAWEAAVDELHLPGVRRVKLRTGIVLGRSGGALPPLVTLVKWFLGGHLGSGRQYVSWIHVKDHARLVVHILGHDLEAVINATAPEPVTNRFFMAALRGVLGRPWAPPVPPWLIKFANWFGGPEPSAVLSGCKVLPKVALATGFHFEFEDLRDALRDLTA